ncbi:hypothetical protein B0T14DRAFT_560004 [Immersiella caudata]|uniref:BTB domain-containing protein n=1 Tax=Immersiella caudata TaxID=314043 RepID=A0AA40CBM7_9PEZI|nr:hypothetical protein B0T14DRAFT_560004 [Immersiella caudata]
MTLRSDPRVGPIGIKHTWVSYQFLKSAKKGVTDLGQDFLKMALQLTHPPIPTDTMKSYAHALRNNKKGSSNPSKASENKVDPVEGVKGTNNAVTSDKVSPVPFSYAAATKKNMPVVKPNVEDWPTTFPGFSPDKKKPVVARNRSPVEKESAVAPGCSPVKKEVLAPGFYPAEKSVSPKAASPKKVVSSKKEAVTKEAVAKAAVTKEEVVAKKKPSSFVPVATAAPFVPGKPFIVESNQSNEGNQPYSSSRQPTGAVTAEPYHLVAGVDAGPSQPSQLADDVTAEPAHLTQPTIIYSKFSGKQEAIKLPQNNSAVGSLSHPATTTSASSAISVSSLAAASSFVPSLTAPPFLVPSSAGTFPVISSGRGTAATPLASPSPLRTSTSAASPPSSVSSASPPYVTADSSPVRAADVSSGSGSVSAAVLASRRLGDIIASAPSFPPLVATTTTTFAAAATSDDDEMPSKPRNNRNGKERSGPGPASPSNSAPASAKSADAATAVAPGKGDSSDNKGSAQPSPSVVASPAPNDDAVNSLSAAVGGLSVSLAEGQQRVEEAEREATLLARRAYVQALVDAHDLGHLDLWKTPLGIEFLVKCKGTTWPAHRALLWRESGYFRGEGVLPAERLETEPQLVVVDDIPFVEPPIVGHALQFMYDLSYAGGRVTSIEEALTGEYVHLHVFKYVCGVMLDVPAMMDFAAERFCEAADFYEANSAALIKVVRPLALTHPLFLSVKRGLQMIFDDRSARPANLPLRAAFGGLMRAMKPVLWGNTNFMLAILYESEWEPLWQDTETHLLVLPLPARSHHSGSVRWQPSQSGSSLPT